MKLPETNEREMEIMLVVFGFGVQSVAKGRADQIRCTGSGNSDGPKRR